ncbi:RNA polymerase sigma factor [Streptomyces alboflavus]|uniref:RNA polymerase sigma factor n=1 Tax=Streptomyces alboflavus TaxID=67267 RepID=UPI0009971E6E|nr:sigma-70 family RNA polymerase sigma factor [Streptomyces alboflavus]
MERQEGRPREKGDGVRGDDRDQQDHGTYREHRDQGRDRDDDVGGRDDDVGGRDEERFRELFEAHYEHVLRFAARRVEAEAAGDVAAETFLVAWRRLAKVPRSGDEARPWLYAVARRVLANQRRGDRRGERLTARIGGVDPPRAGPDHAGDVVGVLHLRQALGTLSARDRETLLLVGWDGLDVADAAKVVGCSRRTFAVRLHRARRRLMRALAGTHADEGAPRTAVALQGRQA